MNLGTPNPPNLLGADGLAGWVTTSYANDSQFKPSDPNKSQARRHRNTKKSFPTAKLHIFGTAYSLKKALKALLKNFSKYFT